MANRVFVAGIGMVSAMGMNVAETLLFARKAKSPVAPPVILKTKHAGAFPLAEVLADNETLGQSVGINPGKPNSRTALLAMLAVQEALQSAGIQNFREVSYLSGTSVGGMDVGEYVYETRFKGVGNTPLANALLHDCGQSTQAVASHFGFGGYTATISTACSSAANAIMHAGRLIASGRAHTVVAGGTDALTRFTVNGFRSLLILSDQLCKPFDVARKGLNMGEGAGYLVLCSETWLEKSGKKPLCELTGYANTCDAYHQTASSPDGNGAWLAITQAISKAGLQPADIDYVNAHGTATPNNDLSEGIALRRAFGGKLPPFSSTKPLTGHTLGAAGGIEAVLSVLSIRHGILYPNLNFENAIPEVDAAPITQWQERAHIGHVLSNSFGFGGNNTSLIFSKC